MSEDGDARMAQFLKRHPRAMGVLFTLLLVATQVQPVLAGGNGTYGGP